MNKLHLSKKKLLAAKLLYWGSFIGCILSIFIHSSIGLPFLLCLILMVAGALWLETMYRCPRCGKGLFTSRLDAFMLKPSSYCHDCGWQVNIEMEP